MKGNDVIQRYMNLPKFMYLLQYSSLFLPKMSIFSDQLEGGLTARDFLETSNDAAILDLAINGYLPVVKETREERKKRLDEANNIEEEIRTRTFITPFGSYPRDNAEYIFPKCREWIYVNCWHYSPHECSAMWQLYGADKNAICIFTTIGKLKEQMESEDNIDTLDLVEVNYLDHSSDKFDSDELNPFISKALPFSFEKEVRVIGYNSHTDLAVTDKNSNSGVNIKITSLAQLIDRIVVSPDADSWFFDSVQKLCNDFNLNMSVEYSSLKNNRIETFFSAMERLQSSGL